MYSTELWVQVLVFILGSVCVDTYRILAVFPTPSISHQVVFRPLTQELAKRGHEVLVVTTDPAFPNGNAPPNIKEIDLHDKSYALWVASALSSEITSGNTDDIFTQISTLVPLLSDIFEMQILTDEIQHLINNRTNDFDLLLIEACVKPAISLSHVFKVPVIYISSLAGFTKNYEVMGAPTLPPLLYPIFLRQRIINLSLWEKVVALYHYYWFESLLATSEERDNKIIKRLFGPDMPLINELENNVHMMFLNVHPLWDQNRPVPPSVIYMGGLHQNPSRDLPVEIKSFLDLSTHGVIYVSFGTNVSPSSLPPHKIQILVRVFSQLPQDVLWKWDQDELVGRTPNIKIAKWLPQSDLLKHPKVKLFITQGGLQSTDEAITAGVPLLGIPMLGDQWFNVEQYVRHKIGLRLDMDLLTEDKLLDAINTILNSNNSYHANIVKLRSIMLDQPQRPLERAVWWTEHVLRHGGAPHLRAAAANMSWAAYLDADLLAVIAFAAILALVILSATLYFLIKFLRTFSRSITSINNDKLKST